MTARGTAPVPRFPASPCPPCRFVIIALCLAAALAPVAIAQEGRSSGAESAWYRSDATGAALAPLTDPATQAGSGWVLRVGREGASETAILTEDGTERRAWYREYGPSGDPVLERVYESGTLSEETSFAAGGHPSVQTTHFGDGYSERRAFSWSGASLASVVIAVDGAPERVVRYVYGPDGRLLSTRESVSGQAAASGAGRAMPSPAGTASWHFEGDRAELRRFGADGRLASVLRYRGTELVATETLAWGSGALASRTTLDRATGMQVLTEYDASGFAFRETASKAGATLSVSEFLADGQGRLARVETRAGGTVSALEYGYGEDGSVVLERRLRDGNPVSEIRWLPGGERVEELYDGGVLFARVHYRDGRKYKEEIIKDGATVRERLFP